MDGYHDLTNVCRPQAEICGNLQSTLTWNLGRLYTQQAALSIVTITAAASSPHTVPWHRSIEERSSQTATSDSISIHFRSTMMDSIVCFNATIFSESTLWIIPKVVTGKLGDSYAFDVTPGVTPSWGICDASGSAQLSRTASVSVQGSELQTPTSRWFVGADDPHE